MLLVIEVFILWEGKVCFSQLNGVESNQYLVSPILMQIQCNHLYLFPGDFTDSNFLLY